MTTPLFILPGQSIMLGIRDVGPEATEGILDYLIMEEGWYPHLSGDNGPWTSRRDLRRRHP